MTIVRWEPLRELTSLQSEMNRLFNPSSTRPSSARRGRRPPLDAGDGPRRDRASTSSCAPTSPAWREEDVNIEVEDDVLTVSGERKAEHEDAQRGLPPRRARLRRASRAR